VLRRSNFEAIGTAGEIIIYDQVSDDAWVELIQKIYIRIQAFDKAYSRFRPDSLVTRMSHAAGQYELPQDAQKMFDFYYQLYLATEGKLTPLIGQTVSDAGYDATYSFQPKKMQPPPKWEDVVSYDRDSVTLTQPTLLDFGAAGKGYLIDLVGQLIHHAKVQTYTINAGGDILHHNSGASLEVGLENPVDTSEAIGIVQLGNQSLCASAGSKRKWSGFHHIIDPTALMSPTSILATWVIADEAIHADGLATALFFTKPFVLDEQFSFSYALLNHDMSFEHSKDFPVQLFEETFQESA
jgi:thiamine biosynthesis lipoprotein